MPVFDPAVLNQLVIDLGDDKDTIRKIVGAYLGAMSGRYQAVLDAVEAQDAHAVEATAHELASASLIVGATELARAAKAVEAVGVSGRLGDVAVLVGPLDQAVADTRAALSSW